MPDSQMQAVGVFPARREVGILSHARPRIVHDDSVRVRCLEVGVCGTDREICTFVYGEPPPRSDYLILGHESLGEVLEVGSSVRHLSRGDLVVPSVRRPCPARHCDPCRNGYQDFCSTGEFVERGIKAEHGYMAEEYVERERFLYPVASRLRQVAVLVEPLTIAEKAMAEVHEVRRRFPWVQDADPERPGRGLRAVVLGTGPIGILGIMKLLFLGYHVMVYSRSRKPNPKSDLVESLGVEYFSALECPLEEFAERAGRIDLVYEAAGVPSLAFGFLSRLGDNGVFVFAGIPQPEPPIPVEASAIMRNLVLRNQLVFGTVNADDRSFRQAMEDLDRFQKRWPEALEAVISGRYPLGDCHRLLQGPAQGIKNVIRFA